MKNQPRIAVFVHHPQCSVQSAHGIVKSLYNDFKVDCINAYNLTDKFLKKYDLLAVPGGIGDSDSWHTIMEPSKDSILNFVNHGKRYLGICMGAYWAGAYYFGLLKHVEPVQYIKQPKTTVSRSFGTVVDVNWKGSLQSMYFYDGCAFVGNVDSCQVIATYPNSDPAAIIQNNLALIGPHPESDDYWYSKAYMKPQWHNYHHHQLLLEVVKELF